MNAFSCTASVLLATGLCATAFAQFTTAYAQSYPAKPIRLVSPYPAGGIDNFARVMLPKLNELLGQPVLIDNRPGAGGNIGAEHVAKSAPDGYTLLFITAGTIISGALLTRVQPFDTVTDFTPIANLFDPLQLLTVHASLPVNSVKELIDYAKRYPGKLSYASSGVASVFHMNGESFRILTGTDMVHVPYKGSAPMATDLVAGRVEVGFPAVNNVKQHLGAGKLRVLAVLDPVRFSGLPEVAPLSDSVPGFRKMSTWTAVFGPVGLPQAMVERLNGVFLKALEVPEVRKFMDENGASIRGGTPQDLAATIRADLEITARLIKAVGIKPE
ncbi:MAG: tripartite tricarboxylate transporter substrate binding protein [Betaproteobacteria bacterium]|nr:tripartite tricarboxylate transporter substrate binding protein [Betaproteobacteria bacterium]